METDVLVVGAGPFGLALSAHLSDLGVRHVVAGRSMSFWREHMPRGMFLRSGLDWHLDTAGAATFNAFMQQSGQGDADASVLPLTCDAYLDYVEWFTRERGVQVTPFEVEELDVDDNGRFTASGSEGTISAANVVVATGFRDFAFRPPELEAMLPEGCSGHTCDVVDFERFRDQRVLIVGGRQSAFESAALLAEAGASRVDIVYRHETPQFTESDWTWVDALMERTETEPGWYRDLSEEDRRELNGRFWAEGRLKLEPWLARRLESDSIRTWPRDEVIAACEEAGGLRLSLKGGVELQTDFVLLATGYRADLSRLAFMAPSLLERIETRNGSPALDTSLQCNVPGLYFTSMAATQDFGPFFAFTVSARCSAKLIGQSLLGRV